LSRRKSLSDVGVANLKVRPTRYSFPDPELSGHFIRVTATGAKSYCAVARDPVAKRQVWATIGPTDRFGILEARERARDAIKRIGAGKPPFEAPPKKPDSFEAVSTLYFQRHVHNNKLRSAGEIQRILNVYILPTWGQRDFRSIRRSDIVALLDKIEDENGPRQADYVLAVFRGIANWFAARNDDYLSPIARGMGRVDPKRRKRARILDDDELRIIWRTANDAGLFGALIKLLLLTAQRREQVSAMRWADIEGAAWRMPNGDRQKGNGGVLLLPAPALEIISALPRIGNNPFVFAGRGATHLSGFSKAKSAFDATLPPMAPWVLHDLRRTARSLMSRVGIRPDIAERVMGHVIVGVEGVYDRHNYRAEKADALEHLATLIGSIVEPPTANVLALRDRTR
jgi:integrase